MPAIREIRVEITERELHASLRRFDEKEWVDVLIHVLARAQLEAAFERVYRVIFGSQIVLLRRLNGFGQISIEDAKHMFEPLERQFPELYKDYGLVGWLGFLSSEKLISFNADMAEITELGRDFLLYLVARRLPENKPF